MIPQKMRAKLRVEISCALLAVLLKESARGVPCESCITHAVFDEVAKRGWGAGGTVMVGRGCPSFLRFFGKDKCFALVFYRYAYRRINQFLHPHLRLKLKAG